MQSWMVLQAQASLCYPTPASGTCDPLRGAHERGLEQPLETTHAVAGRAHGTVHGLVEDTT